MSGRMVIVDITRLEAAHLARLVDQFSELLRDSVPEASDPAIARLVPPAYTDDDAAEREFRSLTRFDLLDRRSADAAVVRASLHRASVIPDDPDDPALHERVALRLDPGVADAWLRTLAAVRLVLATRLGVTAADDHDPGDPRFGIYEWVGYRLDGLVAALDRGD